MDRNPFAFGRIVAGEDFCDRDRELAELRRAAAPGRSIWPRHTCGACRAW